MQSTQGFTLVEILTVVLIIGILTAIGLPQYARTVEKAKVTEAQTMLRTIYDSSDRLAGDFGYRSYEILIAQKGATNEGDYAFGRLDMFGSGNLPRGCSLTDSNKTLTCSRFSYKISQNGYVAAKKTAGKFQGTYILLNRNTLDMVCQKPSETSEACEVYGLDEVNANVSF